MENSTILCTSFSYDGNYVACGHENGFSVYKCDPLKRLFTRRFKTGGIGLIQILSQTNILAMVGGGRYPLFSPNTVMIWDDALARFIGEIVLDSKIISIRLTDESLVIVTISSAYIYSLRTLKKTHQYRTSENNYGLVGSNSSAIVIPGQEKGSLRIIRRDSGVLNLDAHDNDIRCIYLSDNGPILASASEKGTLVKLYNVDSGERLQVLRRGIDKVAINLLCVSFDEKCIVCINDLTTVQLFSVTENVNATSLSSIFSQGNKSIARITLEEDMLSIDFNLNNSTSVYMKDSSSIYLISVSGTFTHLALSDLMQLRIVSSISLFSI